MALLRWQAFTGKEALLEEEGRSFAALRADRAIDLLPQAVKATV